MSQIILALLALAAGLYFLAVYLVDLYNARRGATADQPAGWKLVCGLAFTAIGIIAFFAH